MFIGKVPFANDLDVDGRLKIKKKKLPKKSARFKVLMWPIWIVCATMFAFYFTFSFPVTNLTIKFKSFM